MSPSLTQNRFLFSFPCSLASFGANFSDGIEVTPDPFIHLLNDNLGLITEKVAPLATSSTDWKIVQKTDLRTYFSAGEELAAHTEQILRFCGSLCEGEDLLEEATAAARQAERVLDLLLVQGANEEPHRTKRSLLPFVGKLHKFLYGTLTEDDEAGIQEAIKAVASDTRQTAALLANQTEIIERELSDLGSRMLHLEVAVSDLKNLTITLGNESAIRSAVLTVKIGLLQFKLDTEVITDAILFAAKGLVHPRIFPPDTITHAAAMVRDGVTSARFPSTEDGMSAIPIMKISKLVVMFSDGFLIYQIAIPLLEVERFNLFKASPLPAVQHIFHIPNLTAYIWPEFSYFAVSTSNRTYMPLLPAEVADLRKLGNLLIAVNPEPVREIRDNAPCEIKIASGRKIANPEICDIRLKQLRDTFWLRLHKANAWVFSTRTPEDIFIQCLRSEQLTSTLRGVGILELRPNCAAHTANARLTASRSITSDLSESKFETIQFNIGKMIDLLNKSANAEAELEKAIASETANRVEGLHGVNLENLKGGAGLKEIASKARDIANRRSTAFELKNLGNNTSIFGFSVTSILIIAAISAVIAYVRYRRQSNSPLNRVIKQQESLMALEHTRKFARERRAAVAESSV